MLYSAVILSTLAASALGSNSTNSTSSSSYSYQFPSGFDIGQVKTDELNSWCQGQRNVCPELCKSGTKQNSCDSSTLKFSCKCDDGKTPDVSQYIQTVPFYVCQATFGQCINNHPDDAEAQEACKKAATCGSKNASESDTSSSSSGSASSTSMAVATSTDSSSPSSSSVAAASSTHNAAAALGGIQGISTGLMASVMFLAARLVL